MADLSDDLLEATQLLIDTDVERVVYSGAIATVDPLTVVILGNQNAVPMSAFSDVTLQEGRRVGILKIGADYIVIGGFGDLDASTYAVDVGGASPITVTHELGTLDVSVEVYEKSTGETVYPTVDRTSVDTVNLIYWGTTLGAGVWRVLVRR